jgi:hypothetical protein
MIDEDDFWSNWWNEDWQEKPKYPEKTCPSATLSTTNPHDQKRARIPDRRGGKPATNRSSYGAAKDHLPINNTTTSGENNLNFAADGD